MSPALGLLYRSKARFAADRTMRKTVRGIGRRPKEATAAKKGRTIEVAAPDANITARPPRLAALRDVRSTFTVRSGALDAIALMKGIRILAMPDLPIA